MGNSGISRWFPLLLLAWGVVARGDDFRLETLVYQGTADETGDERTGPSSRNLTLFTNGLVYDFLGDNEEITIYDTGRKEFRLLSPGLEIRSRISVQVIMEFERGLRAWAEGRKDKFLRFASRPEFKEDFDPETNLLTLSHELLTYEAIGLPNSPGTVVQQWRDYGDHFARLNALTHPRGLLPFPRLVLNRELAERNLVAQQVGLVIPRQSFLGGEDQIVRSEHKFFWRLLDEDQRRIRWTNDTMSELREVPWKDYIAARRDQERAAQDTPE